jgi:hypothetical protein
VLRQLARLTRPLPAAGADALAVAVYADAADRPISARESGFEGVACVDDTARLLHLLCDLWGQTELPWVERWARGTLAFVLWMQEPDGRWINFVHGWDGERNTSGITSKTGETFWQARALEGAATAWLTFGDARAEAALHRGLDHAVTKPAPPDVRALHIRTGLRLMAADHASTLAIAVEHWCEELVDCREGDVLMNSPYESGSPHLWAHVQEGVLAEASVVLERPRFLDVAVRSAEALVAPAIEAGFPGDGLSPYDVASCVYVCDRLAGATGDPRWTQLAGDARAWFDGRNPAGAPVYDAERGRVADGIDGDRVSEHSGAEANIAGAEALFDRAVEVARTLEDPLATVGTPGS